jgi:hypothetical protein
MNRVMKYVVFAPIIMFIAKNTHPSDAFLSLLKYHILVPCFVDILEV